MVKDNDLPKWLAFVVSWLEDIQLLAFVWRTEFKFDAMPNWQPYLFNPLSYPPNGIQSFYGTWITALALLVIVLSCAVYIGISFKRGAMKLIWPLHLARWLTTLMGTILIIPIIEILLTGMDCDGSKNMRVLAGTPDTVACFSGAHLGYFVISLIGLLVFVPWVIAMSTVYVDINPKSSNPAARVNGRFDLPYSILRILLAVVYNVSELNSSALKIILTLLVSLYLFRQMLYAHPFYRQTMNNTRAGFFFATVVCSFISLVTFFALKDGEKSLAAYIVLVIATPISFAIGFFWCSYSHYVIIQTIYTRLGTREKSLAKGRKRRVTIIKSALDKEDKKFASGLNPLGWIGGSRAKTEFTEAGSTSNMDGGSVHAKAETISRTYVEEEQNVFDDVVYVELSVRYLRHNATEEGFSLAEVIFREAQAQFPNSAFLHLIFATYIGAFDRSKTQEVFHHLSLSKECDPSADQRFFIFTTERNLEHLHHAQEIRAQNMDVTNYVELQSLSGQAYQYHLESLNHLRNFWLQISSDKLDLSTLPALVQSVRKAQDLYERILMRWPKNKEVLRLFAMFVSVVLKNTELAQGLVSDAQELEDSESKAKTRQFMQSHAVATADNGPESDIQIPEVTVPGIQKRNDDSEELTPHRASRVVINSCKDETDEVIEKQEHRERDPNFDKSSNGSSTTSNKERRQMTMSRMQVEARIFTYINGFSRNLHISSLLLLSIFVIAFAIMYMMSESITGNIDDVRMSTKSRRSSVKQTQNIRDLLLAAVRNDTVGFNIAKDILIDEDYKFRTDYLPYMQQFSSESPTIRLFEYGSDVSTISVSRFNIFDIGHEFINRIEAIRSRDISYYQRTIVQNSFMNVSSYAWTIDGDAAFFLTNVVDNALAFDLVSQNGQDHYLKLSNTYRNSLISILVIFACSIPIVGIAVFHRFLAVSTRRLKAMMSLFSLLPKKQIREILTSIEEAIENLNEDNDMQMTSENKQAAMKNIRLSGEKTQNQMEKMTRTYRFGLLAILLIGASMFFAPLISVQYADQMSTLMNLSNLRRAYVQFARHFSMESIVSQHNWDTPDLWTWRSGQASALLSWSVRELEKLHREIIEGKTRDGLHLYSTTEISELHDFLDFNAGNRCYLLNLTPWDVNLCKYNETIDESIGYTYHFMTQTPLNTMINKYIDLVDTFFARGFTNYRDTDPVYRLLSKVAPHIIDGLQTLDETIQELVISNERRTASITIAIFVSSVIIFIGIYIFWFRNFGQIIQGQFLQIISILFALPLASITSIPELRRFIESGGGSLDVAGIQG